MKAFQKRVFTEKEELSAKIDSLDSFLQSEKTTGISLINIRLLQMQSLAMKTYLHILETRTEKFND